MKRKMKKRDDEKREEQEEERLRRELKAAKVRGYRVCIE